jgi:hypothetical protein
VNDIRLGTCSSLSGHHLLLSWVCIGDFNEVLHRSKHDGVQERSVA